MLIAEAVDGPFGQLVAQVAADLPAENVVRVSAAAVKSYGRMLGKVASAEDHRHEVKPRLVTPPPRAIIFIITITSVNSFTLLSHIPSSLLSMATALSHHRIDTSLSPRYVIVFRLPIFKSFQIVK
jgi:hypothetical protein